MRKSLYSSCTSADMLEALDFCLDLFNLVVFLDFETLRNLKVSTEALTLFFHDLEPTSIYLIFIFQTQQQIVNDWAS